jgi:sialidase-1
MLRVVQALLQAALLTASATAAPPDILFIIFDDMNDATRLHDPQHGIETPNLERLAKRGTFFRRAYCAAPVCNPSRTAALTGLRPTQSGVYGNSDHWRTALPGRKSLPAAFRHHGYHVRGAGEIFHAGLPSPYFDPEAFDIYQPSPPKTYPPEKLNRAPEYGSRNTDWGIWPPDEMDTVDSGNVAQTVRFLNEAPADKPRFTACGFSAPHSPFFAPAAYHRPIGETTMPRLKPGDTDDLPSGARQLLKPTRWFWDGMMKLEKRLPGSHREFVAAYAASCRFADAGVGRILDALDASPRRNQTIIVLWSDHGFHLGEKDHIEKAALWEKTTRVPLIVVAPGITKPNTICDVPVDLTALYPTLLELAGLPADPACDGLSLVPLLKNPAAAEERPPALTTLGPGNHAVRSARWRYIRYADGSEELYDHSNDPHEWTNLTGTPEAADMIASHRKWLPARETPHAGQRAEQDAPLRLNLERTVIPILTDGEPKPVLDLELTLDRPREIKSLQLELGGSCDPTALDFVELRATEGHETVRSTPAGRIVDLKCHLGLPAGVHRFSLLAAIKPGTDPGKTIAPQCTAVTFADGVTLRPDDAALPPLRLAHPIHKRGQFRCHTFRIPAIARAMDGSLLAVYDMRYLSAADLQGHMDIGLSRSTDGGRTWADPVPIMDMGGFGGKPQQENGCSDPNILVDPKTGEILVSAVWTHGKPGTHQWRGKGSEPGHDIHRSSQFMVVRSRDHGKTWSAPENLSTQLKDPSWHLFAPAPGNGIALRDGTLVMPTQGRDAAGVPFSNLMWSKDHGKSWTVSSPARSSTTECAVAELSDGSLLLNMRANRNRADKSATNGRAMALTRDLGKSWTIHPADHGALPEPVCMASMISHKIADGRHVLVFSNPRDKSRRRNMTVQFSLDDGRTWPAKHHILLDTNGGSYSSLVMINDHTLGILYESSQADLVFQIIPLEDLF